MSVAKLILTNEEFLETMLSLPKGSKVGYFNHYLSVTNREGFKTPSIGHLYLLSKMAEVFDKVFVCIVFLEKTIDNTSRENLIEQINSFIDILPCDYVYMNPDQFGQGLEKFTSHPHSSEINWLKTNTDIFSHYGEESFNEIHSFAANLATWKADTINCIIKSYDVIEKITGHLEVVFCRGAKDLVGDLNVYGRLINGEEFPRYSFDNDDKCDVQLFLSKVVKSRRWYLPTYRWPNGVVASRAGFKKMSDHMFGMLQTLDFSNITAEEVRKRIESHIICNEKGKDKIYYSFVNMLTGKEATDDDIKNHVAEVYAYRSSHSKVEDGKFVVTDGKYNFNGECYNLYPPTMVFEAWPDKRFKTVFSDDLDYALRADFFNNYGKSEEEIVKSAQVVLKNYYESFK